MKSIHLKLIVATVFWALTPIFGRLLAGYSAPYALAFGRFVVATVALWVFLWGSRSSMRIHSRDAPRFIALGLSGVCLHNVLVFMGVETIAANRTNVIFATITLMIAMLDAIFLGRRYRPGALLGISLGILGTAVVVTDGAVTNLFHGAVGRGEWLILASAASWAVYSVCGRPLLQRYSPLTVTFYASLFGTVMLAPFVLIDSATVPRMLGDPHALLMIAFLGFFNSAIGFLWYYEAIQRLGAVTTSAYINLVPIFGILLAAVILDESPSSALLSGGVLVIAGLVLIDRYER